MSIHRQDICFHHTNIDELLNSQSNVFSFDRLISVTFSCERELEKRTKRPKSALWLGLLRSKSSLSELTIGKNKMTFNVWGDVSSHQNYVTFKAYPNGRTHQVIQVPTSPCFFNLHHIHMIIIISISIIILPFKYWGVPNKSVKNCPEKYFLQK